MHAPRLQCPDNSHKEQTYRNNKRTAPHIISERWSTSILFINTYDLLKSVLQTVLPNFYLWPCYYGVFICKIADNGWQWLTWLELELSWFFYLFYQNTVNSPSVCQHTKLWRIQPCVRSSTLFNAYLTSFHLRVWLQRSKKHETTL